MEAASALVLCYKHVGLLTLNTHISQKPVPWNTQKYKRMGY